MEKKLVCISCPIGCHLTVSVSEDDIKVTGNNCSRGEIYGKEEVSAPKRIVTAVVKVKSKEQVYIPVKTNKPVLKDDINALLEKLYTMEVTGPIKRGDILIKDYNNTGIDIVFTRSMVPV